MTILSILNYASAGLLFRIYFTAESPGMIMIYLIPLLVSGLLFGIIAFLLKKLKKPELNQFSIWLHYLNLLLIISGIIALIYTLSE